MGVCVQLRINPVRDPSPQHPSRDPRILSLSLWSHEIVADGLNNSQLLLLHGMSTFLRLLAEKLCRGVLILMNPAMSELRGFVCDLSDSVLSFTSELDMFSTIP
ncbi:unnamed protein product [Sphagnum tenellum]